MKVLELVTERIEPTEEELQRGRKLLTALWNSSMGLPPSDEPDEPYKYELFPEELFPWLYQEPEQPEPTKRSATSSLGRFVGRILPRA